MLSLNMSLCTVLEKHWMRIGLGSSFVEKGKKFRISTRTDHFYVDMEDCSEEFRGCVLLEKDARAGLLVDGFATNRGV